MKSRKNDDPIIERLDKILRVLSLQVSPDRSITERARLLKLAGLSNQEISEILNISKGSVAVLTSKLLRKGS